MRLVMTIFYIILIILGVSFAALNATAVQINLYFTLINMPISLLIITILGIGIIIGFFISIYRYLSLKNENRKIRHQLNLTEKEIKNLRAIPLKDHH